MNRPATLETIASRSRRALRISGAPTKKEVAAEQAARDAFFAREGRIAEISAAMADEMTAARRIAAARIESALAETAAELATATVIAAVASAEMETEQQTLEDVAKAASNMNIRFRVWRGAKEARVYCEYANGSRGRPWIAKGYYLVDETASTSRCECDRRGPVEAFEAALAAFLAA